MEPTGTENFRGITDKGKNRPPRPPPSPYLPLHTFVPKRRTTKLGPNTFTHLAAAAFLASEPCPNSSNKRAKVSRWLEATAPTFYLKLIRMRFPCRADNCMPLFSLDLPDFLRQHFTLVFQAATASTKKLNKVAPMSSRRLSVKQKVLKRTQNLTVNFNSFHG